jgi:hypothetical protein
MFDEHTLIFVAYKIEISYKVKTADQPAVFLMMRIIVKNPPTAAPRNAAPHERLQTAL